MTSTFFGLETMRRALSAQQMAMEVTGHNIANANTPGYTRQQALMAASDPYTVPALGRPEQAGQLGTGVTVEQIRRVRDTFLDGQIRNETESLNNWQAQSNALSEVETIFMEPSSSGLNTAMANFWQSWQELSKDAESTPVRTTVAENAKTLTDAFNHTYNSLTTVMNNLDQLTNVDVININNIATQIARLNQQIVNIQNAGDQPNDLLDQRDMLLDQLAQMTDFTVTNQANGSIIVAIDGTNLVDGTNGENAHVMTANTGSGTFSISGVTVTISSGALYGIQQAKSKAQGYRDKLDQLAQGLMQAVNAQHQAGYDLETPAQTGIAFFTGTNAGDIAVNAAILDQASGTINTDKIAAAQTLDASGNANPGDGSNALAIAQLQNQPIASLGSTAGDFYNALIAQLGVDSQQSNNMVTNQQALVDQLNTRKESISGVSLDEEMTNMVQFQYGYQAAARMVSTLDSMLDTLINKMG